MADARRQSAGCWPAEEHDGDDAAAETTGGALSGDSSYQALETSTLVRALAHVVAGGGGGEGGDGDGDGEGDGGDGKGDSDDGDGGKGNSDGNKGDSDGSKGDDDDGDGKANGIMLLV